jgi:hypothetical protein
VTINRGLLFFDAPYLVRGFQIIGLHNVHLNALISPFPIGKRTKKNQCSLKQRISFFSMVLLKEDMETEILARLTQRSK